jgi:hypothetical protein
MLANYQMIIVFNTTVECEDASGPLLDPARVDFRTRVEAAAHATAKEFPDSEFAVDLKDVCTSTDDVRLYPKE